MTFTRVTSFLSLKKNPLFFLLLFCVAGIQQNSQLPVLGLLPISQAYWVAQEGKRGTVHKKQQRVKMEVGSEVGVGAKVANWLAGRRGTSALVSFYSS